jgi:hypothetical protein
MEDWQVLFQQQAVRLGGLSLMPLEMGSKLEEDRPRRIISLEEM